MVLSCAPLLRPRGTPRLKREWEKVVLRVMLVLPVLMAAILGSLRAALSVWLRLPGVCVCVCVCARARAHARKGQRQ
jgi:hypothetical protein